MKTEEKSNIAKGCVLTKSERVIALVDYYADGNKSRFGRMLGKSAQLASDWIARGTLNYGLIQRYFPEVSVHWLRTGEGEMLAKPEKPAMLPAEDNKSGVPLIPAHAMAGALTGEISIMDYDCERYIVPDFHNADFLISVKGDSMRPTYISGDIVACRRVSMSNMFFQWNKTYILDTAQGVIIKRIRPADDESHVKIVSDNSDYAPFELPIDEIYSLALVVGLIRSI